jgi:hypothetical protein
MDNDRATPREWLGLAMLALPTLLVSSPTPVPWPRLTACRRGAPLPRPATRSHLAEVLPHVEDRLS